MKIYSYKHIVYLISSPLTNRDFDRFGIKKWIDNGWKIEVFDISKFLNSQLFTQSENIKIKSNFKGLIMFDNIDEVISAIKKLDNQVIFIDLLGFSLKEIAIKKIFYRKGITVKLDLGSYPIADVNYSITNLLNLAFHPIKFIKKIFNFVINQIKKIISKQFIPNYFVVGGMNSLLKVSNKKTKIIKAHNFDYDFFIKAPDNKNITNNNIIFLDEDGPYHSDFSTFGIRPFVTAKKYYPVVDDGLNHIAKILKLKILIAAHPRSKYKNKKIKYQNIIKENETFELIKYSSVVVAHASTSIQWAVIMKKPIIFVITDEIKNAIYARNYKRSIFEFAKTLGKEVINLSDIDNIKDWNNLLRVDKDKYNKYIKNYIKLESSPNKPLWEIVIQKIHHDLFSIS